MMKVKKLITAAAVALLALGAAACNKVPAGNVGVKYYLLGGDKGVDSEELSPGRYWIGWNEELYLFPTFTVTDVYNGDQQIGFQDKEGVQMSGNFGVTYSVDKARVTELFQKYRSGIDEISDKYVRNIVRNALVESASSRDAETMFGEGKPAFLLEVQDRVKKEARAVGINVESVYAIGSFGLPPNLIKSINDKVEASQTTQRKQEEKQQAIADADKVREAARGEKDAAVLRAEGKADAITIEGEALRKNPEVIKLRTIEEWNGAYPSVMSGAGTDLIFSLPSQK